MERKTVSVLMLVLLMMSIAASAFYLPQVKAAVDPEPVLAIEPLLSQASVGESFTVNLTVGNMIIDLYSWQVQLVFDPTASEAVKTVQGPFLKATGHSTIWLSKTNNTAGTVLIGALFTVPFPSSGARGNGTLASVTFLAKNEEACLLHIEYRSTKLYTVKFGTTVPIDYTTVDGYSYSIILLAHNVDTGLDYRGIQYAIDASETLDGHTILVDAGTCYDNVEVHKSLNIIGAGSQLTEIIAKDPERGAFRATSNFVNVSGFRVTGNLSPDHVLVFENVNYGSISDVRADGGYDGILLSHSSNNQLLNVSVSSFEGIGLSHADNNLIAFSNITNDDYGIALHESSNNEIFGNKIAACTADGIRLMSSSNNSFFGNDIRNNGDGIVLFGSSFNQIYGNNITSSRFEGIYVGGSSNNEVYHNNFISNKRSQVRVYRSLQTSWDDGYPSGGNYWGDYSDVDLYNGPNQDLSGMDGIWDHPYIINASNTDRYPLVKPWPTFSVTVDIDPDTMNLRSRGKWITAYLELPTRYDINNLDASTIRLNDTFTVDFDAPIQIGDHDLDGIADLMVKFNRTQLELYLYNILGIKYGQVTLEITGRLFDGTPFDGSDTIRVNYAGDVNNDGIVNVLDASMVSAHWSPGPPTGPLGYDLIADLNNDGLVNILDSAIISSNWGQKVS